jgi:hypothetical protein
MISHGTPPRRLWHRRQANLLPNDRFPAVNSLRPPAGLGRLLTHANDRCPAPDS